MVLINAIKNPSFLTHEKAAELAKTLTAESDDGWTYKAAPTGEGSNYSHVTAYDENGDEVGTF